MTDSPLIAATRFLAVAVKLGLPLDEALRTVEMPEQAEAVQRGDSLSQALVAQGDQFPLFFLAVVRTAEESDQPHLLLQRLAEWMELRARLLKRLTSVLYYPSLVCLALAAQLTFIVGVFLPAVVAPAMDMLGQPFPSAGLLHLLGLLLGAGTVALVYVSRSRSWLLKLLPSLERANSLTRQAIWLRALSVLIASGMPLLEALARAESVNEGEDQLGIAQIRERVARGSELNEALWETGLDRVAVAGLEAEARLSDSLLMAADLLEDEVEDLIQRVLLLAQPSALLLLAIPVAVSCLLFWLPYSKTTMDVLLPL